MKEALYYEELDRYLIRCDLCSHNCIIGDGKTGICKVRKNYQGQLIAESYGKISSVGFDPIEKKPLYHFYPGSIIFSIGSFGCNLRCRFCQNWEISQNFQNNNNFQKKYLPDDLIKMASEKNANIGIAYTYNEPIVWYEFMFDIAVKAKKRNFKNVVVTNGFINRKPLLEILPYIDAFNVDLKAFSEDFYKNQTFSKLEPVKENLKIIKKNGKHLEITNLIITGLNDNRNRFENMVKWISDELGENTVLHLSRYFPSYKMSVSPTPVETMHDLYDLAKEHLNYVYIGNMSSSNGQDTYCNNCNFKVIDRNRYDTWISGLDKNGKCKKCGHKILEYI